MSESIVVATLLRADGDTGVQTHFRAFAAWASLHAVPVTILTPYDSAHWQVFPAFGLRRLIDPVNRALSVWWYRFWHGYFLQRALRSTLADGQPLTVYAQCPVSAAAALAARASPQQRVIMVVHFNISQADEWVGKGMIATGSAMYCSIRKLEEDVLPRLDGLVFVSEFMRGEIARRIPATGSVPYRIVPNFLADPANEVKPARPETDLICIGTLEGRKNQRYALEIVAAAARLGRPLSLTVVGDGPDRAMLESLAVQLGIRHLVHFAGFMANAAELMETHRACLHVARLENLPLTLIEALSRAVPVFAPAVGGVPEVFSDGCEGRYIALDDAGSAAQKIIAWLDAPESMAMSRLAARKRFLEQFEATNVAASLADFLGFPGVSDAQKSDPILQLSVA